MNCKITRNAAKIIQQELDKEENKELKLRITVSHKHGNHAHYAMDLSSPTEADEVIATDKGFDVLLDKNEELKAFALTLEKVCVDTVEAGFITKDLALLVGPDQKWLSTIGFLDKVDENLKAAMAG